MKLPRCILTLLLAGATGQAAEPLEHREAFSQSGQFIVSGRALPAAAARVFQRDPASGSLVASGWTQGEKHMVQGTEPGKKTLLRLDPSYLVATAERVRQLFNETLRLNEPYRGKVFIRLLEAAPPTTEIVVERSYEKQKRTWNFRVVMPANISGDKLLNALIQTLLLEASHRGAGPDGCDLPRWFTEGVVAHLKIRSTASAIFDLHQGVNTIVQPTDERKQLYDQIPAGGCLSLEQLSWPNETQSEVAFRDSAHALVLELLRLPDGGRCLGQALRQLPQYANWQFAFLNGFQQHFPSLLDAEKWWSVTSLHIGGRGGLEKWSFAASLQHLDELLTIPAEQRSKEGTEFLREEIELPVLLTSFPFDQQKPSLARLISGLFNLELRAAPRVSRLVSDYRVTLERYAADYTEALDRDIARGRSNRRRQDVVDATLQQLARLATLRKDFELLKPGPATPEDSPSLSNLTRQP